MSQAQGNVTGYVFLLDEPASDDQFGAHRRLAEAIADTMDCNPAVRTIGIVGPWGSGKSTVVRLLEKILCERPNGKAPFFSFDAWMHHGEPVRRAFLEEFYRFCAAHTKDANTALEDSLSQVTGRSTLTETVDEPRVSWSGLMVLSALAIGAYGLAKGHDLRRIPWVSAVLSWLPDWMPVLLPGLIPAFAIVEASVWRWAQARRAHTTVAALHGFAGLAVVVTGWAAATGWYPGLVGGVASTTWAIGAVVSLHRATTQAKAGRSTLRPAHQESMLGLLLSRQHLSKRTRVSGATTPTAIEFSEVFEKTLADAYEKGSTVVIVVDNLDRLPHDEARETWAMLRTFFRAPAARDPKRDVRPIVIVPVAEEAVAAMYDTNGSERGQSFMDKTFDVVFHLPRPLLTGWQRYLDQRMRELFKDDLQPGWVTQLTQMADARFLAKGEVITPRGVNSLVNRVGTYWLQYRKAGLSFASVAYYCLNKTDIDKNILTEVERSRTAVDVFDANWRQAITALHYGVDFDAALPVLLTKPFESAIEHRHNRRFMNLLLIPGSETILHRIFSAYRESKSLNQKSVLNAVALLNQAAEAKVDFGAEGWLKLLDALPGSQAWEGFTIQDAADCVTLVERLPNRIGDAAERINECIRSIVNPESVAAEPQVTLWRHLGVSLGQEFQNLPTLFVVGTGDVIVEVTRGLDDMPAVLKKLGCARGNDVLDTLVADLTSETLDANDLEHRLLSVKQTAIPVAWQTHLKESVNRIEALASSSRGHSQNQIARLSPAVLSVLMHGKIDEVATDDVKNLLNSRLSWLISTSTRYKEWSLTGSGMALAVVHGRNLSDFTGLTIPDDAWPIIAEGLLRALRLGNFLFDSVGVPAIPEQVNRGRPHSFDSSRLLEEVRAVVARSRHSTKSAPQVIAPPSIEGSAG